MVGAIAIEASHLASDNSWVLEIAATQPIITGFIGDLLPGSPDYSRLLERLHTNPLFLGVRCGNLWNRDLARDIKSAAFMDGMRSLSQAGLTLDTANPDPLLIKSVALLSDRLPSLRIVVDHLPHAMPPKEHSALLQYQSNLRDLGSRSNVWVKLSEIPIPSASGIIKNLSFYKDKLDAIWNIFGEDRILFGSDWPNSEHLASYGDTLTLVRAYMSQKSSFAQQKVFATNSVAAYRWRPRTPEQRAVWNSSLAKSG